MNNKGVGSIFCLISANLISAKYIAAACFMSNITTQDASWFAEGLSYVATFPVNPFCLCSDHRTFLPGIQYLSGHKEKQKMNEFSTEEINQLHDSFPPFHYSHLSVILPTPRNEFRRHGGGGLLLVLLAQLCVTSGCLPRVSEIRFVPLAKA